MLAGKKWTTVLIPVLAVVLSAAAFADAAQALNLRQEVSGTFNNSTTDTNGDGQPAILVDAGARGTLGPAVLTGLQEGMLTAPSGNCDPGQVDLALIQGTFVHRFHTGDLLIASLVQGGGCLDMNTLVAQVSLEMAVTGGTGRFEGASGSYVLTAAASPLVPDPAAGGIAFGTFVGSIEGQIETD